MKVIPSLWNPRRRSSEWDICLLLPVFGISRSVCIPCTNAIKLDFSPVNLSQVCWIPSPARRTLEGDRNSCSLTSGRPYLNGLPFKTIFLRHLRGSWLSAVWLPYVHKVHMLERRQQAPHGVTWINPTSANQDLIPNLVTISLPWSPTATPRNVTFSQMQLT